MRIIIEIGGARFTWGKARPEFSCKRKVRYSHKETADKAIDKLAAKGATGLETYSCKHCGGWHLGHHV